MSIDPLRLNRGGAGAGLALGSATLPAAWHALDPALATVLAAVWIMLTSGAYALHAVNLRLLPAHWSTPQEEIFSHSQ
jgi:hypothetical protein